MAQRGVEPEDTAGEPKLPAWVDDAVPSDPNEVMRLQFKAMQYQTRLLYYLWHNQRVFGRQQQKTLNGIKTATDIGVVLVIIGVLLALFS